MARVRLSDPTLMDEFLEFLLRSGFAVAPEELDTVRLSLPFRPGPTRTQDDIDVLLSVWIEIGLRIWNDRWPDAGALPLADPDPAVALAPAAGLLVS